jgi:predicted nucleic acid-binding protein
LKKDKVLDSHALLAFFEGGEAGQKVRDILKDAAEHDRELWLSVINWGEVLYVIERKAGKDMRDDIARLMTQMHLRIVDADQEITRLAAAFKARGRISYTDCFAAALACTKKSELVTGDKEFKQLENEIKIVWL